MNEQPIESDETADRIMDAVLHVLAERGLRGATTRVIAQRAGVHEVTLFRKFGSKNGLIRAAVSRQFETVGREGVQFTGDIEADLERLTSVYQNTLQAVGPMARVLLTEVPLEPELAACMDGPRQLLTTIAGMLNRYQEEGKLQPEPMATLVPALLGPVALPYVLPDPGSPTGQPQALDPRMHVRRFLHGRGLGPNSDTQDGPQRQVRDQLNDTDHGSHA